MKKIAFPITTMLLFVFVGCQYGKTGNHVVSEPTEVDDNNHEATSNRPIYDQLVKELDSTEIYNDSVIYGYWFQPHAAAEINLFLHKDGGFELNYCGDTIKGLFKIDGNIVRMTPDDGWGDLPIDGRLFHKHNGTNFYLTDSKKDELYLVKGSD